MSETTRALIRDEVSEKILHTAAQIASEEGAHRVNVRKIIERLGVTNRVFYNRFHNVDEVLRAVYEDAVMKMRVRFYPESCHTRADFYRYATDIASEVLVHTYEVKMYFSQYVFEHAALTESNRIWWMREIQAILDRAKELGVLKNLDTEILSYSIWCFCRGCNVDALTRKLSKEEAVRYFRYGFQRFLDGIVREPLEPIDADSRTEHNAP